MKTIVAPCYPKNSMTATRIDKNSEPKSYLVKLSNIQVGYAEITLYSSDDKYTPLEEGYVETQWFPDFTDFETDETHYVKRWVAYARSDSRPEFSTCMGESYYPVGKITGCATRHEAVDAWINYVLKIRYEKEMEQQKYGHVTDR